MKKLWIDAKVLRRRVLKKNRRSAAHKQWLRIKNRKLNGRSREERYQSNRLKEKFWHYAKEKAPNVFSFNENTEEVVEFINKLENHFEKKKKVYVDLESVDQIDFGAILSLLSIMVRFKAHGIAFNGNFPKQEAPSRLLKNSGFFKHLHNNNIHDQDRYLLTNGGKNEIVTHAWKNVDAQLSAEVISNATKTVWGGSRRCQGVQRALLELMQNTNNHASEYKKGEQHWWLHVSHDEVEKKVYFAFVDFGIGVFRSLETKEAGSKWFGWFEKISNKIATKSDEKLLEMIMSGEFHQTVTGKYYRGKGLPGIAEVAKRNQISNLRIVTNHASANVSDGVYNKLKSSFNGVYVFWELNNECESTANNEI